MLLVYIYRSSALSYRPWNYVSECLFIDEFWLNTVFGMNRMGWLSLTYVSDPNMMFHAPTDDIWQGYTLILLHVGLQQIKQAKGSPLCERRNH